MWKLETILQPNCELTFAIPLSVIKWNYCTPSNLVHLAHGFLNHFQARLWIHKPPFSRWLWRHKFQRPWKNLEMKTQSLSCIVNLLQTICFEFMRFIELSLSKSFITSNLKRHSPLWHLWSWSFENWKNIWTLLYIACAHKISSLKTFSLFKLLL